jgi:hypothetical protein
MFDYMGNRIAIKSAATPDELHDTKASVAELRRKDRKLPPFEEMLTPDQLNPKMTAQVGHKTVHVQVRIATTQWYTRPMEGDNMLSSEEIKGEIVAARQAAVA